MSSELTHNQWEGPGAVRTRGHSRARALLWFFIFPQKRQRDLPTVSGMLLILLALGMGLAAYNTGNNILFIALALLLACLILSGVLAWMNFGRLRWRLRLPEGARAAVEQAVGLELSNQKKWLPSYGLWFEWKAWRRSARPTVEPDIKSILKMGTSPAIAGVRALDGRIEPKGERTLEWALTPDTRGRWSVQVTGVGSLFPFGFFKKSRLMTDNARELIVWPPVVEYQRHAIALWARQALGRPQARSGSGIELHALRPYRGGDSHRMIHWKATARVGRLMVRETAAEAEEGCRLRFETSALLWTKPEEFERGCALAATLAEDLFRAGRLRAVAIDAAAWIPLRRMRDLELFFDQLAVAQPTTDVTTAPSAAAAGATGNLLTFKPSGGGGVTAYLDGQPAATA